ncbi:MAG TPA: hypothetical protein VL996_00325 [Methylocella sp.]|nr:hypothetical protein [Methylocella sp.]
MGRFFGTIGESGGDARVARLAIEGGVAGACCAASGGRPIRFGFDYVPQGTPRRLRAPTLRQSRGVGSALPVLVQSGSLSLEIG